MALHEAEKTSLSSISEEAGEMRRLAQTLHETIQSGRLDKQQGKIILLRQSAENSTAQKIRVQSKG